MKEAFRSEKISEKKLSYIYTINEILSEYKEMGYKLTLRQLYYQLVSRDLIANRAQEYSKLSSVLVTARMNGLTDWFLIEDRLRKPQIPYWVKDIKDAMKDTIRTYRLDRQSEQENHIEIWTEKDAVSNILRKVTEFYHIKLMINRGYSSCSAMKEAFDRLSYRSTYEAQNVIIIYVGDHDPSGLDMIRDIESRFDEFGLSGFKIIHIALTRRQVDEFKPPPNPAKITDPRAKWYIALHGDESWELDALKPQYLEGIVDKAVQDNIDLGIFKGMIEKEKRDKARLLKIIKDLKGKY